MKEDTSKVSKEELDLRYRFCTPWSKMVRRSIVTDNNIEFDETYVANDVCFAAKTGYWAKKIEAFDEVMYCITSGDDSLTVSADINRMLQRAEVSIDRYNFLKEHLPSCDFERLHVTGKSAVSEALFGCKSPVTAFKIWRMYKDAGIGTFYLKDLKEDLGYVVRRLRIGNG